MADDRRPGDDELPQDPFGEDDSSDQPNPGSDPATGGPTQRPLGPTPGEHSPASPGNGPVGFGGSGAGAPGGSGQAGGENPLEALFAAFGGQGGQAPDMNALMQQLQNAFAMFGGSGGAGGGMFGGTAPDGGVNWDVTKDVARKTVASLGEDRTPNDAQRREVSDAFELAESWLDQATEFPPGARTIAAWSRADWVERTMPTWQRLIEPVATHIADAMEGALSLGGEDHPGLPPEMKGMEQMLRPMLRSSGASMFGMQVGQALGNLASEVVGTTDIGLPLAPSGQAAMLPTNVSKFAEGLQQSASDVVIYLALREAARQRLFASAGWLREQMFALVAEYARGITIDTSALEQAVGEIEGGNLEDLSSALEGGLFEPQKTPAQQATLERLETMLALVEGWVDDVVGVATSRWMPSAEAIAEMVRRQRATGGPAEATFATLVGLELRPRRLRDAANLWAAVRAERGADGRDAIWAHPDLLPSSSDLDDPIGYAKGETRSSEDAAFDAALAELLDNPKGQQDEDGKE
ncbi:zinc-dependent metalloprotease [Microlunatus elymi]|uniref:Zinc-dependent metalloprotease n=1 Tax=Microlunatus elymi TaxID=2596828 RepID=A0A516PZ64_9ACTN|nr:zinc-dependent metalloprotease [Microlunatus elymi]QDP96465.1 zinc-dependent metalloprotease [Microlunatus elymi]